MSTTKIIISTTFFVVNFWIHRRSRRISLLFYFFLLIFINFGYTVKKFYVFWSNRLRFVLFNFSTVFLSVSLSLVVIRSKMKFWLNYFGISIMRSEKSDIDQSIDLNILHNYGIRNALNVFQMSQIVLHFILWIDKMLNSLMNSPSLCYYDDGFTWQFGIRFIFISILLVRLSMRMCRFMCRTLSVMC